MTDHHPQAAFIEIVERQKNHDPDGFGGAGLVLPDEVRINGTPLLVPADAHVEVHSIRVGDGDVAKVTLTLFARRVVITGEQA